ncbi:hypothetical protein GC177_02455 [bacterium]|nr:hypothetical protein [bacterium]
MMKKGGAASMGGSKYDGKPDYQDAMKARIEEYKQQMMKEAGKKNKISLPGVDPSQDFGMSENAKKVLEQMAIKKAKKEARKRKMKELAEKKIAKKTGNDGKKGKSIFGVEIGKPKDTAPPARTPTKSEGAWSGTMWGQKDSWEGTMWAKKDTKKDDWR